MSIKKHRPFLLPLVFILLILMTKSSLHALDLPKTQVLMTVAGNIKVTNKGTHALYDLDMITKISSSPISQQLFWDGNQPREYKGFSFVDLASSLEGNGDRVVLLNTEGESFELSWDEFKALDPWIVYESQGESLVKKLGALILIFPRPFPPSDPRYHLFEEKPWKVYKITFEKEHE